MAPKFGTSGLRGLVTDLTAQCIADYVAAFVAAVPVGRAIYVGHDLRDSSPAIAGMVARAASACGVDVVSCGPVPTPALALASMTAGAAAVMVTGSHIPADRNGLKFYTPDGEITKADEAKILSALGTVSPSATRGQISQRSDVGCAYCARYVAAFGPVLRDRRIGLYGHSAVGRDSLATLLAALGATVIRLGFSDDFIPVDTEALPDDLRRSLRDWAAAHHCDAIVSTDADGDRPLLATAAGEVVAGDVLGQIAAVALGARVVVTPLSSNTGVDALPQISRVVRTRIGSPYVIAGMETAGEQVVGFEANGGFLLGFTAQGPAGPLAPLMTRDAVLPLLACLWAADAGGVAALVAAQPPRFTAADRLQDVDSMRAAALVATLATEAQPRDAFLAGLGGVLRSQNRLDGLRMLLEDGRIVHLRPSGNAPELRLYVEAGDPQTAAATLQTGLDRLRAALGG